MNKKKHLFLEILNQVIEDRKYTFKSLGTYVWEKKISKKITPYFKGVYVEDIKSVDVRNFYN